MMNIIVDVCDILSVSISCFVCLKCRILTFKAHLKLNKHKKLYISFSLSLLYN